MGQKVHSVGLRLGTNRKWKSSWFCDLNNYSKFLHLNLQVEKVIKTFLLLRKNKSLLVNCRFIKSSNNTLYIVIFFYKYRKNKVTRKIKRPLFLEKNKETRIRKMKFFSTLKKSISSAKNFNKVENKKLICDEKENSPEDSKENLSFKNVKRKHDISKKKIFLVLSKLLSNEQKKTYVSWRKNKKLYEELNSYLNNFVFYRLRLSEYFKSIKGSQLLINNNLNKKNKISKVLHKKKNFSNISKRFFLRKKMKSFTTTNRLLYWKVLHKNMIRLFSQQVNTKKKTFRQNDNLLMLYKKKFQLFWNYKKVLKKFQSVKHSPHNKKKQLILRTQKIKKKRDKILNVFKSLKKQQTNNKQKKRGQKIFKISDNKKKENKNIKEFLTKKNSKTLTKLIKTPSHILFSKFYSNLYFRNFLVTSLLNTTILTSHKHLQKDKTKKIASLILKRMFFVKNWQKILTNFYYQKYLIIFFQEINKIFRQFFCQVLKVYFKKLYSKLRKENKLTKENWKICLNYFFNLLFQNSDIKRILSILNNSKKMFYSLLLEKIKKSILNYLFILSYQKKILLTKLLNLKKSSVTQKQTNSILNSPKENLVLNNIILKKKFYIWKQINEIEKISSNSLNIWKTQYFLLKPHFFKNSRKFNLNKNLSKIKRKTFYKQYILKQCYKKLKFRRKLFLINFHQHLLMFQKNGLLNLFLENSDKFLNNNSNQENFFKNIQKNIPLTKKQYVQLKNINKLSKLKKQKFLYILKSITSSSNFMRKKFSRFLSNKTNKKAALHQKGILLNISNLEKGLHLLTKCNVQLIFVNALSFVHYPFLVKNTKNVEKQKQMVKQRFRNFDKVHKNLVKRWQRIGFWTFDLINISIISMFMKNTDLLAKFISYQLSLLPKNRRQTTFLKFISKIVLNFKGERKEIVGFKMRFKGRFNRWSRTKTWTANVGTIWFQTYNVCLNYSYEKGIVKKGVFSIKIWMQYENKFNKTLKNNFVSYFNYSKIKNVKDKKFLN